MSLFRKRLSSPNQLATMRELEAQVDVGRVRLGSLGNAMLLSGVIVSAVSPVVLNGAQLRIEEFVHLFCCYTRLVCNTASV